MSSLCPKGIAEKQNTVSQCCFQTCKSGLYTSAIQSLNYDREKEDEYNIGKKKIIINRLVSCTRYAAHPGKYRMTFVCK